MANNVAQEKMATLFLLLFSVSIKNIRSDSTSSAASDDMEREEINYRRKYSGPQEWQYEGLPIEFPSRRSADTFAPQMTKDTSPPTTTVTTTTKAPYPPLDPRFRRIYNPDEKALIANYPFMAALLVNKQLWCGAVVIERDLVLTAAHCLQLQYNNRFFREYVRMLTVRVGSTNATGGGEVLHVTEIFFHPNYKPNTLEFNFAVLRLHKSLSYGKMDHRVEKIEYSRDKIVAVDDKILFLGWGSVLGSSSEDSQVMLQKVELPIYDLTDCQEIYGRELVTRNNFCAGFITIPKNVCNHDAGGPAIMNGKLLGILSFSSKRCDQPDQPAVFSIVGAAVPWLEKLQDRTIQIRNTAIKLAE